MHHFIQHTKQSRLLRAIALSCVVACGGKKTGGGGDTTDSAGGSGGSGRSSGSNGGAATSGAASNTDAGGASSGGTSASTMTTAAGGTVSATTTAASSMGAGGAGASDATGTVDTSGAGGSAGEGTVSTTGATGGAGGTGMTGPTGAVATLGEPCDSPGELACAGNYQKLTLVCGGDGEWDVNQTCAGEQFCDSREGVTQGTCQDPDPACVGLEPGARFCDENTLMACGEDTLSTKLVEECSGLCESGVCNDAIDACPEQGAYICASDCDGPRGCSNPCSNILWLASTLEPSLVVRTPNYDGACEAPCDSAVHSVSVAAAGAIGDRIRVEVPAPWRLAVTPGNVATPPPICELEELAACAIFELADSQTYYAHIYTRDTSASPRNVGFELVGDGDVCP